jgi:uncharacterized protein
MIPELLARLAQTVPIGLVAGLLSGAFGIGGGIVMVPLIRHWLGVSAHEAVGNSLAAILPTAAIGALNYSKKGKLVPLLALACGIPAALGTSIASLGSHYVPGQYLMLLLACLMILVGIDFVTGFSNRLKEKSDNGSPEKFELNRHNLLLAVGLGLLTGLMSGMLGVGGGFILVPSYCYFLNLPLKVAFGTSLLVVALVALPGTAVHACQGHVQPWIALPILAGSLPGAWLGSHLSLKTRDKTLRIIFGSLLLVTAVVFAWRELTV